LPQRLRAVIGNESIASFARRVGVSRQWLHDILNGKPVSLATLSSIADSTGYNLDWLARGKGMPSGTLEGQFELVPRFAARVDADGRVEISVADEPPLTIPSALFNQHNIDVANVGVLAAPDNGMFPIICAGDDVLIDRYDRNPTDGGVYIVAIAGCLALRRAVQTQGAWVFLSEDPKQQPLVAVQSALSEPVSVGGRVRFLWRSIDQL
jgi:transcriptional regulator with XRE-family HTH domain